ncbi:MAG: DUF1906 domain-containing protein [Actinobacteria bacterium]|nr:DUF1906 domain-containing protein [Actinomycetota bacterium]
MAQLIDYAWTKPTPAQIIAAGYEGVLRYLSLDSSKNLTPGERDALLDAGLSIGLVWETTATRAGQGYVAGQHDVQAAEAQAAALGYPMGCPIFYAVDYDTPAASVLPYFQGVAGLARWPVGVYGSANVVEAVPVPWKWQTVAWSHSRVSQRAHLYQTTIPTLAGCDLNKVLSPVPLWSHAAGSSGGIVAGGVSIPGVPVFPTTTSTTTVPTVKPVQEDPMFIISSPGRGQSLIGPGYYRWLQTAEEVDAARDVATVLEGNDRQFDLWRSIALDGVGAHDLSSSDPATLAAAIAALIPPTIAAQTVALLSAKLAA